MAGFRKNIHKNIRMALDERVRAASSYGGSNEGLRSELLGPVSEDTKPFVKDNPFQFYNVSTDAAVASTVVGAHALYLDTFGVNTGGSTTTGRSSTTLNIGATHATNDTWRLVRSAEDPENNDLTAANCTVVVVQNLNQYIDSSGS